MGVQSPDPLLEKSLLPLVLIRRHATSFHFHANDKQLFYCPYELITEGHSEQTPPLNRSPPVPSSSL